MPFRFTFALSFAGSDRERARQIRDMLKAEGFQVFYDNDYEHEMVGTDASLYLRKVYTRQSRFCIVLISQQYDSRQWTQLERESIQSRELTGERDILIPVKLEDYSPEWLPATRVYFDLTNRPLEKLIEVLKKKARSEDDDGEIEVIPIEAARKESFLRGICKVVKSHPTGDASWANMLFPQEIARLVGETISLQTLVDRAKETGAIDNSFEKTAARLKRDWDRFAPNVKRGLIDEIHRHGLSGVFSGLLFLTQEEEAYLRIAWGVADARYDKEKTKAYERCREIGIDLLGHKMTLFDRMDFTIEKINQILGDLIRTRVKIDLEQVLAGAGQVEISYVGDVAGRAQSAYFAVLKDIRECWLSNGFSWQYTEECLEQFKRQAEAICRSPILSGGVGTAMKGR